MFYCNQLLLCCLFLMAGGPLSAQSLKAYIKAGDEAMEKKNYHAALEYYSSALEMNAKKIGVAYKLAGVARAFYAYDIAEEYYRKVAVSEQKDRFPLTLFYLAEVKRGQGEYAKAIDYYQQYLGEGGSENKTFAPAARRAIADAEWAMAIIAASDGTDVQHLNKRINTPYSEFGPYLKGDSLYYSSLRYEFREDEHVPPRRFSKVLRSVKGAKGRPLGRGFNAKGKHTAHNAFSRDGKRLYYNICEYSSDTQIRCELYFRTWNVKRRRWNKAQKLSDKINLPGYTTTQPNIGYDEVNQQELLFFVSDRPGGQGQLDLWVAPIKSSGDCGEAVNIAAINTPANEASPFYHNASGTLFFSSEGHQGMGGYDIFQTLRSAEGWMPPQHTGYPLNSSYNDLYFVLNADSTVAYMASNRTGSFYLDKNNKSCCNDIYRVLLPRDTFVAPPHDTLVPPPADSTPIVVTEPPTPPIDPLVDLPPVEKVPETLEDFLPLALYFHNDEPDRRTRRTTTKKSYEETYRPYYALKAEYIQEYTRPIEDSELALQAEYELDDFFESKVRKGYEHLRLFSDILLKRLNQGEKVEIFIKGFTSPRAQSDYNLSLGKRRVSSLRNHFDSYAEGVFLSFIRSGQLIISERSFGETTAATGISDDLQDRRNSVYSVPAAVERRVEIVEIKRSK